MKKMKSFILDTFENDSNLVHDLLEVGVSKIIEKPEPENRRPGSGFGFEKPKIRHLGSGTRFLSGTGKIIYIFIFIYIYLSIYFMFSL
jgi:hypothetical protein